MKTLEETNGKPSSIRRIMFILTFASIGLAFYGIHKGLDLIGLSSLCAMFLGAGVGGKVWQKGKESA